MCYHKKDKNLKTGHERRSLKIFSARQDLELMGGIITDNCHAQKQESVENGVFFKLWKAFGKAVYFLLLMILIVPAGLLAIITTVFAYPVLLYGGLLGGIWTFLIALLLPPVFIVLMVPLLVCIAPFFLIYGAFTGDIWPDSKPEEPDPKAQKIAEQVEAFNVKWELVKDLPPFQLSDEAARNFEMARDKLKDSTSEFADNCPGEGKYLLGIAADYIKDEGEFGRELVELIDMAIVHSFNYNEGETQSALHKMIWDCARLITLRLESAESKN